MMLFAHEDVFEIDERIESAALRRYGKRVQHREIVTSLLVAEEQRNPPGKSDDSEAASLALLCAPCRRRAFPAGGRTPPRKLSLPPEALGAAHEVTK